MIQHPCSPAPPEPEPTAKVQKPGATMTDASNQSPPPKWQGFGTGTDPFQRHRREAVGAPWAPLRLCRCPLAHPRGFESVDLHPGQET